MGSSSAPQITSIGLEERSMHLSRVSDLVVLEQSIGRISRNPLSNLNSSGQSVPLDASQVGDFSGVDITRAGSLKEQAQALGHPSMLSFPVSNNEHWGDSTMADRSPWTDASTDIEADENNQKLAVAATSDSSDKSKDKLDQKTLRRLAQNREAARKSRLRKKAYVQQLESSRLKLTQLEQELQRTRQQGIFISGSGDTSNSTGGNRALMFDMEYARWLEDHNRYINDLRIALRSHAGDTDLRALVDSVMAHYEEIFRLKNSAAKADIFHLLSGMWKTPAERCFLWLGGFRSSEVLKLLSNRLEPLTEQQLAGLSNLQQSSQQAEEALSQGMEALQQSLSETLTSGSLGPARSSGDVANYMGQMAMAMGKLGTLENFICQADKLRLQTLQQMQRILTARQSARAFIAIDDYFSKLRALSSLWVARPQN